MRLGDTVTAIDRGGRTVTTASGERIPYGVLVLATGTRVRPLPLPGTELDGVMYLRTLEHAEELARRVERARKVVVIGGGFIGLEVAAAVRLLGKPVTVLEAADRLMGRVVAPVISSLLRGSASLAGRPSRSRGADRRAAGRRRAGRRMWRWRTALGTRPIWS